MIPIFAHAFGGVAWIDIVELQVRALSISSSENSQGGNMAIAHYEISSHVSTILIVRNLGVPKMCGPKDNSTGGLLLLCFLLSGRLIFTHFLSACCPMLHELHTFFLYSLSYSSKSRWRHLPSSSQSSRRSPNARSDGLSGVSRILRVDLATMGPSRAAI